MERVHLVRALIVLLFPTVNVLSKKITPRKPRKPPPDHPLPVSNQLEHSRRSEVPKDKPWELSP